MVGKFLGKSIASIDMDTNMSLDDIIQKKFRNSGNRRGKRGGPGGKGLQPKKTGGPKTVGNVQTNLNKLRATNRGGVQGRRIGRGGGNKPVLNDARSRIITQNRQKITDAREKLGQIAKMSDARLKLNKLHNQAMSSGVGPLLPGSRGGITMQTGRNGQIQLTTNRAQRVQQRAPAIGHGAIPSLLDGNFEMEEDMASGPSLTLLRRTVQNTVLPPPSVPMYTHPRQREAYTWRKSEPDEEIYSRTAREPVRVRTFQDLQPVKRRQQTNTIRMHTQATSPQRSQEWLLQEPINRRLKVSRPVQLPRDEPMYIGMEDDDDWIGGRSSGVKSRLDAPIPVPHSMGILAAESKSSLGSTARAPAPDNFHRIVVSNLQKSVTNEDIRELFEDIGSLLSSKLVRPGTAEVVYRSRKDAMKAVDIYHNRQLDGEPMKCMLVNSRPLPVINQATSRTASSSHLRGVGSKFPPSKKTTVYPDMDTIHRALFNKRS